MYIHVHVHVENVTVCYCDSLCMLLCMTQQIASEICFSKNKLSSTKVHVHVHVDSASTKICKLNRINMGEIISNGSTKQFPVFLYMNMWYMYTHECAAADSTTV